MAADAAAAARPAGSAVLNINCAVMGHVDAGKTSLVRALSTELSTAALDKHPQSQERGITLDLGFSAFQTELPPHLAGARNPDGAPYERLQFTLVDCPGHASLIRTVIGGAQIIDMMLLVIDAVKGIQTQTAECLVIGEVTTEHMVVVINKIDMLLAAAAPAGADAAEREKLVDKVVAKVRKALSSTKFADAPFVALSAAPGGGGKMGAAAPLADAAGGVKAQSDTVAQLVTTMKETVRLPQRDAGGPFFFAIDHCFPIKGQGTVLTGTVLSGACRVNDAIELPALRQSRKVKSMQMFKKPVQLVRQGDRAGICVTNLDATLIERGVAASPGTVPTLSSALCLVKKIKYFKGSCESEARFHVTVGHTTVMATAVFFGAAELARAGVRSASTQSAARAAAPATAPGAAAATSAAVSSPPAEGAAADGVDHLTAAIAEAGPVPAGDAPIEAAPPAAAARSGAGDGPAAPPLAAAPPAAEAKALADANLRRSAARGVPPIAYDWSAEFEWQAELLAGPVAATVPAGVSASVAPAAPKAGGAGSAAAGSASPAGGGERERPLVYEWQWAALLFDTPILCPLSAMVIGSRLDADIHANSCRLAFYGRVAEPLPSADLHELRRLNLYKRKLKQGAVDRIDDKPAGGDSGPITVIGRSLFKKETDMHAFVGMTVHTRAGQVGQIESGFGKSGKFKATFRDPRSVDAAVAAELAGGAAAVPAARGSASAPAAGGAGADAAGGAGRLVTLAAAPPIRPGDALFLRFRKYQYERKDKDVPRSKLMVQ